MLTQIAGNTLKHLGKCTLLVLVSSLVSTELRQSTQNATNGVFQTIRYARHHIIPKASACAEEDE